MAVNPKRIFLLLAMWALHASAQIGVPNLQRPVRQTTSEDYRVHLASLRSLVQACRADARACDPPAVGDDEKVVASGGTFQVRWQWLRGALEDARNPRNPNRTTLLDQAAVRLDQETAAESSDAQPSQPAFSPARHAADSILARPEFRVVNRESWLDRKTAQLWAWFYRMFTAASEIGHRAPWLGRVLEWSFVGAAVALVLVWGARTLRRERLTISLGDAIPAADWQKESDDWAALAQAEAERSNWREAIHCLYWASIVVLESRRLWRRDVARTPREYLALLERGSPQQHRLRSITRIFERIWYGLRTAAQEDYVQTLALFEELRRA
jgi:hypothetical protein